MYFTFIMLHDILEENIITFNNLSTSSSTVTNIANISLSLLLWSQNTWIFLWKFLLSEDTAKSAPLCYKMYYFALSFFFDLFHCTFLQINETLKHNNWLQWLIWDKNCSCVFSFCLQEANQLYPSHETQQLSLCDCVCMCVCVCVCVCVPVLSLTLPLPQLSSTPLQVLFYLNSWYFAAFYLAEILMFIYKGLRETQLHWNTSTFFEATVQREFSVS